MHFLPKKSLFPFLSVLLYKRQFWYRFQYLSTLLLPSIFFAVNTVCLATFLTKMQLSLLSPFSKISKSLLFSYTIASLPELYGHQVCLCYLPFFLKTVMFFSWYKQGGVKILPVIFNRFYISNYLY